MAISSSQSQRTQRPTIRDVAAASGVSTATVSRALAGDTRVDPAKVALVRATVEELGYTPNGLTRAVFQGQSNAIGMLIGDVRSPFYMELIRGAEEVATAVGTLVVVANTSSDQNLERKLIELMDEQRVRGLVVNTGPDTDAVTTRMAARGAQVVVLARRPSGTAKRVHSVHLDDEAAGAMAATHLYNLGRKRLAIIASSPTRATQVARTAGVLQAGPPSRSRWTPPVFGCEGADPADVAAAVRDVLEYGKPGNRPDAIVCTAGILTHALFAALSAARVRIPDDVGLVSFDDFPWAPYVDPPITVVDQPSREMGVKAAQIILSDPPADDSIEVVMKPTLVVRRSCGSS